MLPGFRNVYRYPAFAVNVKVRPAVITRDLRGVFIGWERESDFEARGNSLGARHGDKQRMKIGAVTLLGITGVENVSMSPASSSLVVAQSCENVVVDGASFLDRLGFSLSN